MCWTWRSARPPEACAYHACLPNDPRDHVRRPDVPDAYPVFRLSRGAVLWRAMGAKRNLAQYRTCCRHPVSFCAVVFCCLRCLALRPRGDSHLHAGPDLDCFGIAHGDVGGVCSLQGRALISARGPSGQPLHDRLRAPHDRLIFLKSCATPSPRPSSASGFARTILSLATGRARAARAGRSPGCDFLKISRQQRKPIITHQIGLHQKFGHHMSLGFFQPGLCQQCFGGFRNSATLS